ncbi:S8 family serine peptidase [Agromyces sp. NPDC058136]|uniref:S8 family serine peptidase n=1 Tax=Agromyces sp. NPDC058136 TaxID=3346354 RepID=UPI0036DEC756
MTAAMVRRSVWSAAAICALAFGGASAASADEVVPGDWYVETWGVQESLDAGNDGAGVQVAVIDTQFNPEVPTLQGVDLTIAPPICYDQSGALVPAATDSLEAAHGTNSVSLIAGTGAGYPGQTGVRGAAPRAKVTGYAAAYSAPGFSTGLIQCIDVDGEPTSGIDERFEDALDDGADIITIQLTVGLLDSELVARAMREGVIVLAGLDNEPVDEMGTLGLAMQNGVVGVQAIDAYGDPQNGAGSTDIAVDVAAPGVGMTAQAGPGATSWEQQTIQSGTSDATPFTAGVLAAVWSKYPDATGNQILQSMVRNTGLEDHELTRDDSLGYGILSLRHMLSEDPTQYDDVNPLIVDDREFTDQAEFEFPRYEEIFPDSVTPAPSDEPGQNGSLLSAVMPLLLIGGGIGLIVLIGVVVLIVVLVRRKKH